MAQYEIEIKSLLGSKDNADALIEKMRTSDPACARISKNTQLNHYFTGGDITTLYTKTEHLFKGHQHEKFKKIVERGSNFSVRTRQKDTEVLLVIKASLDEGSSENTVSRLEFEEPVSVSLSELDALVQEAGYTYQAKWSREREEYAYKDINVCIDLNAGYGYLAEFEKVVDGDGSVRGVREELIALMNVLGVVELPQDRLERMFTHYNQNWRDYYGTDKTFVIE